MTEQEKTFAAGLAAVLSEANYPSPDPDTPPEILKARQEQFEETQRNLYALNQLGQIQTMLYLSGKRAIKVDMVWFIQDEAGWRGTTQMEKHLLGEMIRANMAKG